MRTCQLPVSQVEGAEITTIEGLSEHGLHRVQQSWIAEQAPQCGYCQSGQIMQAVALLEEIPNPTDEDIDRVMTNVCRCGAYGAIRRAIHRAASAGPMPPIVAGQGGQGGDR